MDRNFHRRVEACFPIFDAKLKKRVINEGLMPYLEDNKQAWEMDKDGCYQSSSRIDGAPLSAQEWLLAQLAGGVAPAA